MLSKINPKLSVYIVVLALAFGAGAWAITANQPSNDAVATKEVSVQAKAPTKSSTEVTYTAKAGVTSLEQLQSEVSDVVVVDSEYGKYVDSIERHKGGTDGKYWSFYVDGQMSEVGADTYMQTGGEQILWKFQKL